MKSDNQAGNAYFINLNTIKDPTLLNTQVLNWIKIYDEYGIHFDLIVIEALKNLLTGKRFFNEQQVRSDFSNKMMRIYLAKAGSSLCTFLVLLSLPFLLIKPLLQRKTIILQTRSELYMQPLRILKRILGKRFKVIYDSRGASPEEYKYAFLKSSDTPQVMKRIAVMRWQEKEMVQVADRVLCVSNALKNYHIRNNPQIDPSRFFVSPCNADPSRFYYDPELRRQVRDKLGVNDKKVIVYSGGLKMPWHIPDGVFELFARLSVTDDSLFLLMLTSEDHMAREFQLKHKIPDERIRILNLDNKDVCAYLNASDWSVLLRHDMPVNNVASPTKFAEYLMTGLPVIISPHVGDFSDFVVEHDIGCVIPTPYTETDLVKVGEYLKSPVKSKEEIALLGAANFSKKANIEPKIELYRQLAVTR